ncbi:unnamed protein product [Closterium sp. NIES-64]|nr:unnamed protein product [Closterium sp. NIES-64]
MVQYVAASYSSMTPEFYMLIDSNRLSSTLPASLSVSRYSPIPPSPCLSHPTLSLSLPSHPLLVSPIPPSPCPSHPPSPTLLQAHRFQPPLFNTACLPLCSLPALPPVSMNSFQSGANGIRARFLFPPFLFPLVPALPALSPFMSSPLPPHPSLIHIGSIRPTLSSAPSLPLSTPLHPSQRCQQQHSHGPHPSRPWRTLLSRLPVSPSNQTRFTALHPSSPPVVNSPTSPTYLSCNQLEASVPDIFPFTVYRTPTLPCHLFPLFSIAAYPLPPHRDLSHNQLVGPVPDIFPPGNELSTPLSLPPSLTLSHPLPPSPTLSHPLPPSPTLSHPIPPYPTLSHPLSPSPTLSHPLPPSPTLSHPLPPSPTLSHPIPPSLTLSHPLPPSPTLSHHSPTLSHPLPPLSNLLHPIPFPPSLRYPNLSPNFFTRPLPRVYSATAIALLDLTSPAATSLSHHTSANANPPFFPLLFLLHFSLAARPMLPPHPPPSSNLSRNYFTGPLPKVYSATAIALLDLSRNYFFGSVALSVGRNCLVYDLTGTGATAASGSVLGLEGQRSVDDCSSFCRTGLSGSATEAENMQCGGSGVCLAKVVTRKSPPAVSFTCAPSPGLPRKPPPPPPSPPPSPPPQPPPSPPLTPPPSPPSSFPTVFLPAPTTPPSSPRLHSIPAFPP